MPPNDVLTLLRRRLDRLAEQRTEIRDLIDGTLAGGVHPMFLVEEDYRLALLDAESLFVERLVQRIDHPETGWARPWSELHGEPAEANERQKS